MAVETIRGNLSTTGRLRANLAVGGGSEVTITPTYNSGTKIADYSIDGEEGEIYIPVTYNVVSLYHNETATNENIVTLLQSFKNFDDIILIVTRNADNTTYKMQYRYNTDYINVNDKLSLMGWARSDEYISYSINSITELQIYGIGNNLILTDIVGVKY